MRRILKKRLSLLSSLLAVAVVFAACGSDDPVTATLAKCDTDEPVATSPSPGAGHANTETNIFFCGTSASDLEGIEVSGSESGAIDGEIEEIDGRGTAFVPAEPFAEAETVTVSTDLDVAGSEDGDFSFETFVSGRATVPPGGLPPEPAAENVNQGEKRDSSFVSNPDLKPPPVSVNVEAGDTEEGYVFLAPEERRQDDPRRQRRADLVQPRRDS